MTTVDSLYWGCYYITSLIESFETYRLIMIFKSGGKVIFIWIEYNWSPKSIKTERISILDGKLFQSDLMSRDVSFHSSFSLLIKIFLYHCPFSVPLQWPTWSPFIENIIFCWGNVDGALHFMCRECTYSTSLTEIPLLIRCKPCSAFAQRCKLTWKRLIRYV